MAVFHHTWTTVREFILMFIPRWPTHHSQASCLRILPGIVSNSNDVSPAAQATPDCESAIDHCNVNDGQTLTLNSSTQRVTAFNDRFSGHDAHPNQSVFDFDQHEGNKELPGLVENNDDETGSLGCTYGMQLVRSSSPE